MPLKRRSCASRCSLERLGCLARRARAHGEHGAGDLVEVRGGLLGEVHVGEPRRDGRLDGDVDQLRRPLGPLGVVEPRVDLERLVATPAQHALDEPARCLRRQQRAGHEDAEGVDGVVLEVALRHARALREQQLERLVGQRKKNQYIMVRVGSIHISPLTV